MSRVWKCNCVCVLRSVPVADVRQRRVADRATSVPSALPAHMAHQLGRLTQLHTFVGGLTVGAVAAHQCLRLTYSSVSAAAQPTPAADADGTGAAVGGADAAEGAGTRSDTAERAARSAVATVRADGQQTNQASEHEDTIVQYIVLRKDLSKSLKWTPGPIMTQACHASCAALWLSRESSLTQSYCSEEALDDMTKVMMEIKNEGQLRKLSQSLTDAGIGHKLWTEQPEDFPTALATFPVYRNAAKPLFKKCQLYKA